MTIALPDQVDLGQLVRPRRRPLARVLPAGRQVARRSRSPPLQRDAGPRDEPRPEDLGAQGHQLRAGGGAGVGRLHHLDRLGGAAATTGSGTCSTPARAGPRTGMKQRIGHATCDRPAQLEPRRRRPRARHLGDRYEEYTPGHWHDRAMRDPWVMRDPDGDGWMMYFTARRAGRRGAERRRRHRLRHLAGPLRLDAAGAGLCRRHLRADGGAAGLRGGRPLVLPVLHRGRALVEGLCRAAYPGTPVTRHALPRRRRPARAVDGGAGAVPRRRPGVSTATRRGSSTPTRAWCCSASCTIRAAGPSSARSPTRSR